MVEWWSKEGQAVADNHEAKNASFFLLFMRSGDMADGEFSCVSHLGASDWLLERYKIRVKDKSGVENM